MGCAPTVVNWGRGNFAFPTLAIIQHLVGGIGSKSLKCLFAPFGSGGFREIIFHGGVLNAKWLCNWADTLETPNIESFSVKELGEFEFKNRVEAALADPELNALPRLKAALLSPETGANALITDVILHRDDGEFWRERTPRYEEINVPIYVGACWGSYGIHLPALSRAWERISAYKKMVVGPPLYLDRPVFQFQYESLRWFDHC